MEHHDWTPDLPPDADQRMKDYHVAVTRNIDGDYCRSVRQRAEPEAVFGDQVKPADRTNLERHGENEISPGKPQWPAPRRPRRYSSGFAEPNQGNNGGPLVLPKTQTPAHLRAAEKDAEFTKRLSISFRDVAPFSEKTAPSDYRAAMNNVPMGWLAYSNLYGIDICNLLL